MREDNINRVSPVCRKWLSVAGARYIVPLRFSNLLVMNRLKENLTGAALRPKSFFESGNDFAAEIADLRFGQRRLAALERHAHQ